MNAVYVATLALGSIASAYAVDPFAHLSQKMHLDYALAYKKGDAKSVVRTLSKVVAPGFTYSSPRQTSNANALMDGVRHGVKSLQASNVSQLDFHVDKITGSGPRRTVLSTFSATLKQKRGATPGHLISKYREEWILDRGSWKLKSLDILMDSEEPVQDPFAPLHHLV